MYKNRPGFLDRLDKQPYSDALNVVVHGLTYIWAFLQSHLARMRSAADVVYSRTVHASCPIFATAFFPENSTGFKIRIAGTMFIHMKKGMLGLDPCIP
jgi:hypothetical protein